jgi:hypothetical protein
MKRQIDSLRRRMAAELSAIFFELQTIGHAQGRYFYEGEWRTPEQIAELYREMKHRDRRVFFELLLVMAGSVAFTGFVVFILYSLCCSG